MWSDSQFLRQLFPRRAGSAVGPTGRIQDDDDDDELMLNVLRCQLTY